MNKTNKYEMNNVNFNKRQFWSYQRLTGAGNSIKNNTHSQKNKTLKSTKLLKPETSIKPLKTKKLFHVINNKIATDKKLINRLSSIYIPPAYKDIVVAKSANNKIQAIGTDKRGRRQYIYNTTFTKKRNDRKYDDILELGKKIHLIESDNEIAINNLANKPYSEWSLPNDYIPIIVYMLRTYYFRIGNERYVNENNSYGITTLKSQHIKWHDTNSKFTIEFVGKKGILNQFTDNNKKMGIILKKLIECSKLKGHDNFLFKYKHIMPDESEIITFIIPEQIQVYFQDKYNSYITPKMFRTWYGNYHLLVCLKELFTTGNIKHRLNKQEKNEIVKKCSEHVSSKLNNTPTVSKQSYIDNKILELIMRNPYRFASQIPDSNIIKHNFLLKIIKKIRNL